MEVGARLDPLCPQAAAAEVVHSLCLYENGAFPSRSVAEFLMAGIAAGESGVIIATPEHGDAIKTSLAAHDGAMLDSLERSGRLLVLSAENVLATFMQGRQPDPGRFVSVIGGVVEKATAVAPSRRVRAFGEMVALLNGRGNPEAALALERLWNDLLLSLPLRLCCAYPREQFGREADDVLESVCDEHDGVEPQRPAPAALRHYSRRLAILRQQARAMKVDCERRNEEFMAMLGHELRNPLAPIIAALDGLEAKGESCCQREREIIRRQTEHLGRMVGELLDVSGMLRGRGAIVIQREPIEMAKVLSRAVDETRPFVEERAHRLCVTLPTAGLAVDGDSSRLLQVFTHLLTNAARYTPRGGEIRVSGWRDDSQVVVEVADTGCGLSANTLATIFEPFVQGTRVVDHAQGGLGLGLTVARMLLELHGGSIDAHSNGPGLGSTFTVRLPAVHHAVVRGGGAAQPPRLYERTPGPLRGRRLLLVDDNRDMVEILALTLEGAGYDVCVAYDAAEALKKASDSPPDVALLDIGLPLMDGYELARRLRERRGPAELRLIAFSGYGMECDRARSEAAGFDLHLVKPASLEKILRAIEGPRSMDVRASVGCGLD